jgi:hypothetical protein
MNSPVLIPSVSVLLLKKTDQPVQRIGWASLEEGATQSETSQPLVPLPTEPHCELQAAADGSGKIVVTCTCGRRIEVAVGS